MRSRGLKLSLRLLPFFLLALLGTAGPEAPAASADAVPAFQVTQRTEPTNFVPGSTGAQTAGPRYIAIVRNVGRAASESFTITDNLPPGTETSELVSPFWNNYYETGSCPVVGQTVTCVVTGIGPGERVLVTIPVKVSATASEAVSNELVVEGGGAPTASSVLETSVTVEPPSFGFPKSGLFASVADEAGNAPAAGSHPFIATFNVEVPSVESDEVEAGQAGSTFPAEGWRSAKAELPQGFVVNPQGTTALCTERELSGGLAEPTHVCPPASQVGWAMVGVPSLGETLAQEKAQIKLL